MSIYRDGVQGRRTAKRNGFGERRTGKLRRVITRRTPVAARRSPHAGRRSLFCHEWILVIERRRKRLLDRPRAHPAHEVQLRTCLVVRAGAARAAERLL